MQELTFESKLAQILAVDTRYHVDAYLFVKDALEHTQKLVTRKETRLTRKHVTGQELLEGIRAFGLEQFGPMAKTVLAEWGVTRCEDFGEIVFNMVEVGLLGKTETDSRDDFKQGYCFDEAFRKPFLPTTASRKPAEPSSNPA